MGKDRFSLGGVSDVVAAFRGARPREHAYHFARAGDWLLQAQRAGGDGGYAHSYSLSSGWMPAYPETTGYIVPTMLMLSKRLGVGVYGDSARAAGRWLLDAQMPDGSFVDLSGRKQVFDTGQILEGLIALYAATGERRYMDAAVKSGDFLVDVQDPDGKWSRFSYNNTAHAYYSRVAAGLIKLYGLLGDVRYKHSAEKNIAWVIAQQCDNGYVRHAAFEPSSMPYLHTIIYVLEGLLGYYSVMRDDKVLSCVYKTSESLCALESAHPHILRSQYDSSWHSPRREYCLTGLAQWAGVALDLYGRSKNGKYLRSARRTIAYLKKRQVDGGSVNVSGALPGSMPLWGTYFRYSFNNWTQKFFIDAVMRDEALGVDGGI